LTGTLTTVTWSLSDQIHLRGKSGYQIVDADPGQCLAETGVA
jgi:hypothetical protein